MEYYIFVRSLHPPSGWELLEAINHPRIAEYALGDYEKMLGDENATEVRMIRAENEAEARALLPS
jgi:hypothetical protein